LYKNFLKKLSPKYVICSCGYNDWKEERVIDEKTTNTKTFHTPIRGAVTVKIDQHGEIQTECYISGNNTPR